MAKKRRKTDKKGQMMGMPFQFIFSMILIAVVLFVAFWAIKHFMATAETANIGDFVASVKSNIYNAWSSGTEANMTPAISFSSKFEKACFANLSAPCSGPDALVCTAANAFGYSGKTGENLFLVGKGNELGVAEAYGMESGIKIMCGDRDCISLKKNPVCHYVSNGDISLGISVGEKYGCASGKVCIF